MKMEHPKYREKVLIGLESAPRSFNVRGKVAGTNGTNLQYITNETGAIVTIRGRGSGYLESNGRESLEPLHICIEHSKYEVLQAGRQLAFNLIDTVQQEWANYQQELQQQQQVAPIVQAQQPQVVSSSSGAEQTGSEGLVQTSVAAGFPQNVGQIVPLPPMQPLPPPALQIHPQIAPQQVSISSSNNGSVDSQSGETPGTMSGDPPLPQQPIPANIPQQQQIQQPLSIQSQQLFVTNQGALIQPQTIIPHQPQVLGAGQVVQQPQIIQSYPVQYVQTNNGQMVVAYPNIIRPSGAAEAGGQQQVMLVQYGQAVRSGLRTTAPQQSIPQIVQIVNPQTGQVQHVLQHVQPQLQMQQVQLQHQVMGQSGMLGQQVLMPIQAPIQFASQPQQMIIQPQHQLQQQHVIPVSQALTMNQTQQMPVSTMALTLTQANQIPIQTQKQGQKRRYEGEPTSYTPILPSMSVPPPAISQASNSIKKGIGADSSPRSQPQPQMDPPPDKGYTQDEWRSSPQPSESGNGARNDGVKADAGKRSRMIYVKADDGKDKSSGATYKLLPLQPQSQVLGQPVYNEHLSTAMFPPQMYQTPPPTPPTSLPQPQNQQYLAPQQLYSQQTHPDSGQPYNTSYNSWIVPQ